jgi:hypothetical protein
MVRACSTHGEKSNACRIVVGKTEVLVMGGKII